MRGGGGRERGRRVWGKSQKIIQLSPNRPPSIKVHQIKQNKMSGHKMHRSNSSSMVAWSSHSPLSRTYSVSDISTYANAADYFKKRWSTAYNPYHYSRKAYYWPHHRRTSLFPLYSLVDDTRYFYESPFFTRAPTCSPAWDYSANSNYYTFLLDSVRPVWRCWPYPTKSSCYEYRTYWPWRKSIRSHFWYR